MSAEAAQPGFGVAPEPLPEVATSRADGPPTGFAPEPVQDEPQPDATVQRPAVKGSHRGEPEEPREPDEPREPSEPESPGQPSWWHRDHPISAALFGFYAGMVFAIVVPGAYAAVMGSLYSESTVTHHFYYVLLVFLVPVVLAIVKATRRFGLFMLLGTISTLVVVAGVAAGVGYFLYKHG